MKLALTRIDDRLVHGQVIEGCCGPLHVERILLASDEVSRDSLQERLYRAAVPPEVELVVENLRGAARRLQAWDATGDERVTLVVVESPRDLLHLVRDGAPIDRVNLGGLHHREGTREYWPGFYLDEKQAEDLRSILRRGIPIEVQSIPGAACIDAAGALESR